MNRERRTIRRGHVARACASTFIAVGVTASLSCHDQPTAPDPGRVERTAPPRFNSGSGGDNPDSLPPGSFAITLIVDDGSTGIFQKRQFASYSGKTLVKFTAGENIQKIHRVSGNTTWIDPRGHPVAGGCYSYVVVDFRKAGNVYGGGWAGLCNAQLVQTLVLEGTGTAHRVAGYPWNGTQQCGGLGQPTCFEYGGWHKVQLTPTSQKLEVVVDSSSVVSGSTVRFTARRTDGGTFTVQTWTWKPLTGVAGPSPSYGPSATGCSVDPICDAVLSYAGVVSDPAPPSQRGYMYVRALVNGIVETARAEVVVVPPASRLVAQCSPQTLVRTAAVDCTGEVSPSTPWTLTRVTAVAGQATIFDDAVSVAVPAGQIASIAGPAIVGTSVTFQAQVPGYTLSATASFSVLSRVGQLPAWAPIQIPDPQVQRTSSNPPLLAAYPGIVPQSGGYEVPEGAVGVTYHRYPQYQLGRPTDGPNKDVVFVTTFALDRFPDSWAGTYVSNSLYAEDPFYQRQTGGSGFCGAADMDLLRSVIVQHERTHHEQYVAAVVPFDPQGRFEARTLIGPATPEATTSYFEQLMQDFDAVVVAANLTTESVYNVQDHAPECEMRP